MADDVDVDADAGIGDHAVDHGAAEQLAEPRPPGRPQHDLRRVERTGGLDQRLADVGAHGLPVLAAQLLDELALAVELLGRRRGQTVLGPDVDGDEFAVRPLRHPRRPPDHPIAARSAGHRHDHALLGLPGALDAVPLAVLAEALVDPVRDPQERKLSKRGQVSRPEVVGQRDVDALRRVDVPAREPGADRLRGEIDELKLVGAAHDLVRNRLLLTHAGDLLDDVVERLEVLDVHRRDDSDPCLEQLVDVLPALLVSRPRRVRVRELVHQDDVRPAGEHRVDVELLQRRAPVLDRFPGDDLEIADLLGRGLAAVGLDETDDDVLAALAAAAALVQHRVGLPHARSGAEVDAERSARHGRRLRLVEREVELEHVHGRLAEEAERTAVGVLVDQLEHLRPVEAPGPGDPIRLETGVLRRDVRVETGPRRGQRVDRRLGVVRLAVRLPTLVDGGQELLVQRPEIRRRARHRVVAVPGRRRARMEVALPLEGLGEQLRADDGAVSLDE